MSWAHWGGSEELWSLAAMRMSQEGYQIAAAVHDRSEPVPRLDALTAQGVKLVSLTPTRIPPRSIARRAFDRLRQSVISPLPYARLDRILDETKPDFVVHSLPFYSTGIAEAEICRRRGIPYALIVQAASAQSQWSDNDIDQMLAVYTGARACFFVARGNQDEVERSFGQRLANGCVVRNPFNVPYSARPGWPSEHDGYRLACVGRLEHNVKGQDIVFEVLARPAWRQRPISISLVGSGSAERAVRRLTEMYGVSDRVRFLGFTENIVEVWADHHAMILPSRREGLPLAVVEAMLCNRPCIVTDVAGNGELIQDGVTGFVAKAPTTSLLDEAMERAWEQRHAWKTIGAEAGEAVRKRIPADPVGEFVTLLRTLR